MFKHIPKNCPVCSGQGFLKFIQSYKCIYGNFSLYECSECNVQFWTPFKNPGKEWYEMQERYRLNPPKLYRGYHKKFLSLHPYFSKGTRILDLGCGTGEFIAELQKRGCEVWGVDSDIIDIDIAKQYYGLRNVYAMPFDTFFLKNDLPLFDIITFFEVIEHLDNPLIFIQNVKRLLKPDGSIFLSTPSRERMFPNLYPWDFPPYHLSRWNKKAISKLFNKIGFKIVFIDYVDEFLHFLDLTGIFSAKLSLTALRKKVKGTQKFTFSINCKERKKKNVIRVILNECIFLLRKFKWIILNVLPSYILWSIGKIGRFKNGVMVIELKKSDF